MPADLPQDIGLEWEQPVNIRGVTIDYVDSLSVPADDGWELHADKDAQWITLAGHCKKLAGDVWEITFDDISTRKFRLYFNKMSEANTEAVANDALTGGNRAGYPLPTELFKETGAPKIREITVHYSE